MTKYINLMSQSYTILPFINPPAGAYDALNAVASLNNNFTTSQSFNGIVNSGSESCASLSVSGVSTFTGVCTFNAIPKFNAGIEVAIAEVDTGTLSVTGLSSLSGGLTVLGDVSLPAASIVQSFVSSGYTDLVNTQTVAGVKTFSSPPVASGASISANTIPAASLVNKSIADAQIALSGISQTSVASGYVDLVNAQSIAGAKTLSGLLSANAGLSVTGATTTQSLAATGSITATVDMTAPLFTGALAGNATSATLAQTVNIITDNTAGTYFVPFVKSNVASDSLYVDDATTPLLTYNPSTGVLSAGAVTSAGIITGSGGMNLTGSIVYNAGVGSVVNASNDVAIALGGTTLGTYSVTPSANVNTLTLTGTSACSSFELFITPSAAITWRKAMSAGSVTIYNNLAGNQAMASGSRWLVRGKCLSTTIVYLQFTNFT